MDLKEKKPIEIKQNQLQLIEAVLAMLANYMAAVSFFVILCGSLGAESIRVGTLCLFAGIPFIFFALRRKSKKISLFIGGHFLVTVLWCGVLILGNNTVVEWIGYLLLLLIYIGVSFYMKSKRDGAEQPMHPAVLMGILVTGLWILNYVENEQFQPYLLILLVMFLGIYFAHYYLENYLSFVRVNKISDRNFQRKKLLHSGATFVGGYLGFLIVLLLFFTNPVMGKGLASGLKTMLLWLLKIVLLLFSGNDGETESVPVESVEETQMPVAEEIMSAEPSLFARIVDQVLEIMLYLLFIAAIIAVVRWIVRKLHEMFGSQKRGVIIEGEASVQDITEQLEREEDIRRKKSIFYGMSANARIRKTYAKFMLGHRKKIEEDLKHPLSGVTARESALVFKTGGLAEDGETDIAQEESLQQAAETYEKARYSEEECTAAELRALKKRLSKVTE